MVILVPSDGTNPHLAGNRKEKRMERHYETIWIVRNDLGVPGIKEIQEKASAAIESGEGRVNKVDEWGVRRFAYPIQKRNEGYYTLMDFNAPPATVVEMEKIFKYNEDVVRYQTVRLDEEYVEPVVVEPVPEPAAEQAAEPTAEPAAEAKSETPAEAEAEKVEAVTESKEKAETTEEGPTDA